MSGNTALFRDQVVIVTGASHGIGAHIATQLAAQGAKVVLAARRATELEQTAVACRAAGAEALVVPTDVTSDAECARLVAAAIDKYVYITVHQTFVEELIVKYSKLERVMSIEELEHPIVREAFRLTELSGSYLEVASMADIPAGTGLGSSGSFTTALLKLLHAANKNLISPAELAEQACHIEIDLLGEPIGKQDQYIATFGGLTSFTFRKDGSVDAAPLAVNEETRFALEDSLLLFFTGFSRSASSILKDQDTRSRSHDQAMVDSLHYVKDLGKRSQAALEKGDIGGFGRLMHEHWLSKRKRSGGMSNPQIDHWYDVGMNNGAVGGKLIGAGGGGFLMFYAADKTRLRHAMREKGLQEVRFRFDFEGSKVVTQN